MTPFDFSLAFSLGLVSSIHCVQMCGPIVLAYSLPMASAGRRNQLLFAHLAYNLGRVLTYSLLGALAGLAGGAVGLAGRLAGVQNGARIVAGAAMIVAGLALSGLLSRSGLVQIDSFSATRFLSRFTTRLMRSSEPGAKFRLGLLLGFLPCGLVYGALLKSVESGTATGGALTMGAFGLGTAGALLVTGLLSSAFGRRLGRWSNALASASIILMGLFLLWRGLAPVPPHIMNHHGHSTS